MRTLLLALPALAFLVACPPAKPDEPLPPSGLAGAPGAPTGANGLALPGAGMDVPDPSGTATPSTGQLPPGHPPIPGANQEANGMPAGHPPTDGAMPAANGAEPQLTGTVEEVLEVPEYTYMRVKTSGGEEWVAVSKTQVAVGDSVTVTQSLVMQDFPSRHLNKTFPKLVMGVLVGEPKKP